MGKICFLRIRKIDDLNWEFVYGSKFLIKNIIEKVSELVIKWVE